MTRTELTPFGVLREQFSELAQWLKTICRANFEDYIVADYKENSMKLTIFTKDYSYHVSAKLPEDKVGGYLGCIVQTRKPRAGEDWNRGNDLSDGQYSYETWIKIISDIVAYEMVRVAKQKPKQMGNV